MEDPCSFNLLLQIHAPVTSGPCIKKSCPLHQKSWPSNARLLVTMQMPSHTSRLLPQMARVMARAPAASIGTVSAIKLIVRVGLTRFGSFSYRDGREVGWKRWVSTTKAHADFTAYLFYSPPFYSPSHPISCFILMPTT